MVQKFAEEENILRRVQILYPDSFHEKVSSSKLMSKFYAKAVELSGAVELIENSAGSVTIVDICGGRGVVGDTIKSKTAREFNYVVVDISRKELGGERWKNRVMADMLHIPVGDRTADVVFSLNTPVPLAQVKEHAKVMKVNSLSEEIERGNVIRILSEAVDNICELNLLNAARILKNNGVLVVGNPFAGHGEEDAREQVREIPMKLEKYERVKLSHRVISLWKEYGSEVDSPVFVLASFRRVEGDIRKRIEFRKALLENNIQELEGNEFFKKVVDEMEREAATKKQSFAIDKSLFESIKWE